MENTFFQPRIRVEKRVTEKNTGTVSTGATLDNSPQDDRPTAHIRTINFQPRDLAALSQLEVSLEAETALAPAAFHLNIGETPAEFVHLYAALERIVSRVGDVSMVTGNLMETDRPYLLGVTSAISGEGKTTTALHLAMTIARCTPKRVCLIDLSLSDNDLSARIGMPPSENGLVAAIEDNVDHVPCFNMAGCENLMVVPAGRPPVNASKFVRTPRVAQFLVATRHAFDIVIVDLPAVATENAVPLCRHTDGVLMVVRAGVTPRDIVIEALEKVGPDHVNCVVLNRTKPSVPKWLRKRYSKF